MKRSCGVTVALLQLAPHCAALAQVATGNIRGTVMDASEAIIASAKVTLVNANTGLRRTVATNENGDFNAPRCRLEIIRSTPRYPASREKLSPESTCR